MVVGFGRDGVEKGECWDCCSGLDMLLLWWPGDWALWSSGDEAELGECIEMGAPTAPDMSMGSHEVVGLRLDRLECDMVVKAVEVVMFWVDAAGYEKRSRCC